MNSYCIVPAQIASLRLLRRKLAEGEPQLHIIAVVDMPDEVSRPESGTKIRGSAMVGAIPEIAKWDGKILIKVLWSDLSLTYESMAPLATMSASCQRVVVDTIVQTQLQTFHRWLTIVSSGLLERTLAQCPATTPKANITEDTLLVEVSVRQITSAINRELNRLATEEGT